MENVVIVGKVPPLAVMWNKIVARLPEEADITTIHKACVENEARVVYFSRRTAYCSGMNNTAEPLHLPGSTFMGGKPSIKVYSPARKGKYQFQGLLSKGIEKEKKEEHKISYSFFADGDHGHYRPGELRDDDYGDD